MRNQYYLLRHGHSVRNVKHVANCWPEKVRMPLTGEGRKQIKKASERLKKEKIDLIFFSDLLRTKQAAEIVGKTLGIKPKADERLREVDVGVLNGKPIREIGKFWDEKGKLSPVAYYSKRFKVPPPKGETYTDIEERTFCFIKEMERRYKGKKILVISHARPITLLEKVMHHYTLKKFAKIITEKKEIRVGELRKLKIK